MAKQSVIEKALIYGYDPSLEPYPYDITHFHWGQIRDVI